MNFTRAQISEPTAFPSWRNNYKTRYATDGGELIAFCDHDWKIRPLRMGYEVFQNGAPSRFEPTIEAAFETLRYLTQEL